MWPVRCEDVALILPRAVDVGEPVDESVQHHVNSCLACQAELARYHKLVARASAGLPRLFAAVPVDTVSIRLAWGARASF